VQAAKAGALRLRFAPNQEAEFSRQICLNGTIDRATWRMTMRRPL
jgi:hypothetical protein